MKKIYNTFIIFALSVTIAYSQEADINNKAIFGVPQYLAIYGLRFDYDYSPQNNNKWLIISPMYFSDQSSIDPFGMNTDDEFEHHFYDKLQGLGLGIERKIFLTKKNNYSGFYLSYGGNYRHYQLSGSGNKYIEYTGSDGLFRQQLKYFDNFTMNINSVSLSSTFGVQLEPIESLLIDVYMGYGLRYSIHKSDDDITTKYNRGPLDFGYTGTLFVFGVRFGILL